MKPEFQTILVKSPVRFVVAAPGRPSPASLIASGDDISDLLGYYSIREAGLEKILGDENNSTPQSFVQGILYGRYHPGPPYISIDYWDKPTEGSREELYSLLIESHSFRNVGPRVLREFENQLIEQIRKVVQAYHSNDGAEMLYLGQMLSTFISAALRRAEEYSVRRERISRINRWTIIAYAAIMIGGLVGFGVISAFDTFLKR